MNNNIFSPSDVFVRFSSGKILNCNSPQLKIFFRGEKLILNISNNGNIIVNTMK